MLAAVFRCKHCVTLKNSFLYMKKNYCSPACEFVEVEIDCIMQAGSNVGFGGASDKFDAPRRGEFGNLWAKEAEN